ncbi:MAG TPA: GNAT family N-acetyltransferase [Myxococcaceae bacterium]|nr:GNAT family N-acetyltransferase [Myxococcaceae bacterium]
MDAPEYQEELELRWRVLRKPLGHGREAVAFPFEAESLHLLALDGGHVVGCVLFHPEGATTGRLFQMAVEPERQGLGLGTRLVRGLEVEVAGRGFREVVLHARDTAIGFYARLGYVSFGAPYVEVGIPHQNMRRALRPASMAG